ncbi:phage holin [Staphylococcus saprophyticus]|uniref:phage holin n=1 Tax=Staphylococcus saprophyticus TaxID=29385 RepID=UPI000E68117B|nr:phage holin [Staphylococcus saprophyticus]MDW4263955.1 phage holin [Staphylococcus saprophyticus]RIO33914.1 phage holin [Staphylococcus saprophyticus]
MNFILRLKNKATLTAIVGAILLFIKQITEAFGVDLSAEIEQVSGLIGAIITFLVGIGVVTDPTTVGVKDSGITKTYTKPRDENVDPVEYQREGNTFTPKEYDTREDFSDDSDEIEFYSTLADGGQHPDDAKHLEDEEQPEDDTDEGLGQRGVDNGKN